jgi:hypothetical protein
MRLLRTRVRGYLVVVWIDVVRGSWWAPPDEALCVVVLRGGVVSGTGSPCWHAPSLASLARARAQARHSPPTQRRTALQRTRRYRFSQSYSRSRNSRIKTILE